MPKKLVGHVLSTIQIDAQGNDQDCLSSSKLIITQVIYAKSKLENLVNTYSFSQIIVVVTQFNNFKQKVRKQKLYLCTRWVA